MHAHLVAREERKVLLCRSAWHECDLSEQRERLSDSAPQMSRIHLQLCAALAGMHVRQSRSEWHVCSSSLARPSPFESNPAALEMYRFRVLRRRGHGITLDVLPRLDDVEGLAVLGAGAGRARRSRLCIDSCAECSERPSLRSRGFERAGLEPADEQRQAQAKRQLVSAC